MVSCIYIYGVEMSTTAGEDRDRVRPAYTRIRPAFHAPALAAGFEQLVRSLDDRGVSWEKAQVVGMSWDNYETTPMDRLTYDLCIVVPETVEAAGPFGIREIGPFRRWRSSATVRCS